MIIFIFGDSFKSLRKEINYFTSTRFSRWSCLAARIQNIDKSLHMIRILLQYRKDRELYARGYDSNLISMSGPTSSQSLEKATKHQEASDRKYAKSFYASLKNDFGP